MAQDDLIAALQQAVRQEVAENYFRERRILEEERNLLVEEACAFHGGQAAHERAKAQLALALLEPEVARRLFDLAGAPPPDGHAPGPDGPLLPEKSLGGLTRCGRHRRLVAALYHRWWRQGQELAAEHAKLMALLAEVNDDIRRFEANHDLLALTAYMRSLDPMETQRRKIMGVNFSHAETAAAAAELSFRPLRAEQLGLGLAPEPPAPPERVLPAVKSDLRAACRRNRQRVRAMLAQRRRFLENLG